MSRFPGFQTKTVELGGLKLQVPQHWNIGPTGDGRWQAGDSDEVTTLYTLVENFWIERDPDQPQSTPTANIEPYVAQVTEFLKTIPTVDGIEIERIQSGSIVHAADDFAEAGEHFRSYRWYVHNGRNNYVARTRLTLIVRLAESDEAEIDWLVDNFWAQAYELNLITRWEDHPDVVSLQDLTVDDLIAIRIPDDWSHEVRERDGTRMVWCYPRDPQVGKVGIIWEHGELRPEYAEGRDPDITNKLADLRDHDFVEDDERRRIDKSRYAAPLGVIIRMVDDDKPQPASEEETDTPDVRHHQWCYVITGRRDSLVMFFNLMIPLQWIDRPEVSQLVELVEREIRALRLLPRFDAESESS